MNTAEQMRPQENVLNYPDNLEFDKDYDKPLDLHGQYYKLEKEIKENIEAAETLKNSENKELFKNKIIEIETINDQKRESIAKDIINKYLKETPEGNYYINCLVPTDSCIPRILNHVLEKTLSEKFNLDEFDIASINTIFAEMYNNYKGKKEGKSTVDYFATKLLIKPHELQILTGDPTVTEKVYIKDLNPEDLLSDEESISESGRGLPICKSLCEATDGEFSARTNKDETSWTYLAKINY